MKKNILIIILVLAAGLASFYISRLNDSKTEDKANIPKENSEQPVSKRGPEQASDYVTYSFAGSNYLSPLSFMYPKEWKVEQSIYVTAGGASEIEALTITPSIGGKEDVIVIGGRQAECNESLIKTGSYACAKDIPVRTSSTIPEIQKEFDYIVSTIK